MEKNNSCQCKHHGGSGNGFLFGVIVGAAIVFLLATKKGKQILQTLTENGFEGVSGLSDLLSTIDDDEAMEDEYMEEPAPEKNYSSPQPVKHAVRPLKRLFRGVKR